MIGAALRATWAAIQAATARPASRRSEPEILASTGLEGRRAGLAAGRIGSRTTAGVAGTRSNMRGLAVAGAGAGAITAARSGAETCRAPTSTVRAAAEPRARAGAPTVGVRSGASVTVRARTRERGEASAGAGSDTVAGRAARGLGAESGWPAATRGGSVACAEGVGSACTGTASGATGAAGAAAATAGSGAAAGAGSTAGEGTATRAGSSPAGSR
jgi:hypothetical protein